MSQQPFRFLDLPPEIREKIYTLLIHSPSPYISLSPTSEFSPQHSTFPHSFLLVSSQIYHELRPLYFSSNAFSLNVHRRNDNWSYFLSPSFLDNRRQIRHLRIVALRWGTKNFFTEVLGPVVEDCILNGRLRALEVVVREGWIKDLGMFKSGEGENWTWLRRVLGDVYLESGVLRAAREMEMFDFVEWGEGDGEGLFRDVTSVLGIGVST
jgi:hypothetical protein